VDDRGRISDEEARDRAKAAFRLVFIWPVCVLLFLLQSRNHVQQIIPYFFFLTVGLIGAILAIRAARRAGKPPVPRQPLAVAARIIAWLEILMSIGGTVAIYVAVMNAVSNETL
jgi:hypothetical protein